MTALDKFKNISFKTRKQCVICDTECSQPVIELPDFPLTEIYVNEKISEKMGFVDQAFHFCNNCGHGQIANIIDPEIIYGNNYATRTSTSQSAINAIDIFLEFTNNLIKDRPIKSVIDIGCNDLYTLKKLKNRAEKLYGIDPILTEENQPTDDKIEVIGDFVENVDFHELGINMDIVLSSHALEHIENPKKLIRALLDKATSETLFFFQFPGLESLVQNARFDQIFHQHLNYFSLKSVIYLLNEVGAELIDFKINPHHWGTLMIAFKKKDAEESNQFKDSIVEITDQEIIKQYNLFTESMNLTNKRISSLKHENIYGYGAALMLPILKYYISGLSELKCIIDDDKNKEGLHYLNLPLKIVNSEDINNIKDSVVLITAINSKHAVRSIASKLINLNVKEIIIPTDLM